MSLYSMPNVYKIGVITCNRCDIASNLYGYSIEEHVDYFCKDHLVEFAKEQSEFWQENTDYITSLNNRHQVYLDKLKEHAEKVIQKFLNAIENIKEDDFLIGDEYAREAYDKASVDAYGEPISGRSRRQVNSE